MGRTPQLSYSVRKPGRFISSMGGLLVALAASGSVAGQQAGQSIDPWDDSPPADGRQSLTSLQRLVRHFDFEEAQLRPMTMPINFHRVVASDRGFPAFGRMELRDDQAAGGSWSLCFDLNGGSMAARVPTAVIPVLPFADYAVSVKVRTQGLRRSGVRLVAQMHDQHGVLIQGSRVESPLVRSNGSWSTITINADGDFADAADLVLELQLLQPAAVSGSVAGEPLIEDIRGTAWFDSLDVWHLPRVELTTGQPGNVVMQGEPLSLFARIIDMASEPLRAELWVYDLDGQLVHHALFDPPVELTPQVIALPITDCGWYRAVFDVHGRGSLVGRRWLDFAVVPPLTAIDPDHRPQLAIDLTDVPPQDMIQTPELVRRLCAAGAILPAWLPETTLSNAQQLQEAIASTAKSLLDDRSVLTFSMMPMPDELARSLGLDPDQVLTVLADPGNPWRPYMEHLLIRFGLETPRWIVGGSDGQDATSMNELLTAGSANLARYVPQPDLAITANATDSPLVSDATRMLRIEDSLRSSMLEQTIAQWNHAPLMVAMNSAHSGYTNRQRMVDLIIRTLHAWRHGPDTIVYPAPWLRSPQRRGELMPRTELPGIRTLIEQTNGRRFVGTLELKPGLNAWIMQGLGDRSSALVMWRDDSRMDSARDDIVLALGSDPVIACDAFGNHRPLIPTAGQHQCTVGTMPVFIEGIDVNLALFRANLRLDQPHIQSAVRVHERQLEIHNPWPVAITGEIRLRSDESLQIRPRMISFTVGPGQSVSQPIECTLSRVVLAGPAALSAEVVIDADTRHHITTSIPVEIGLRDVRFTAHWLPARDAKSGRRDLMVSVHITNDSDQPVNLDAFAIGAGISQQRTAVGILPPGSSTSRHFTIADGLTLLAGQTIRVGVAERDGPARLNTLLEIPPLGQFAVEPVNDGG